MPRKKEIDGAADATNQRTSFEERAVSVKDRPIERLEEDHEFVPVIVKRTDESRRHPDDVLVTAIAEGLEQLSRPALSLGLSSIAAGLILGFTAMAVAFSLPFSTTPTSAKHGKPEARGVVKTCPPNAMQTRSGSCQFSKAPGIMTGWEMYVEFARSTHV
jgi:hypothetical protein